MWRKQRYVARVADGKSIRYSESFDGLHSFQSQRLRGQNDKMRLFCRHPNVAGGRALMNVFTMSLLP